MPPRTRFRPPSADIATDVHSSGFGPLFGPGTDEFKEGRRANVVKKLAYVESTILKGKETLLASGLSIADLYLYVVLGWVGYVGVSLESVPQLVAFRARLQAHPTFVTAQAAMDSAA